MGDDEDIAKFRLECALSIHRVIADLVEGAILVDDQARIQWISDSYIRYLGVADVNDVLGRPVESLLPHSLMRSVVETGKAHPIDLMQIDGRPFLPATRLPLRDSHGRVVGAFAFAFKDFMTHLQPLMDRIMTLQTRLNEAEEELVVRRRARYTFENIIGVSPAMIQIRRLARRAAQVTSPVLLLGETGTGKELVAQAIHSASPRCDKPFVGVNMTAVPENLMEAEFFGVAPGAYTGAKREQRPGKFQLADHGTLFLDEVGDMPLAMQSKMLRVLQEHEVEPLGSNRLVRVDVRVIAATSRDLQAMMDEGSFRRDLYYRLNVLPIRLPSLRERKEDLELLAFNLVDRIAQQMKMVPMEITPAALAVLASYDWPGNVRELANVIEQAYVRNEGTILDADNFIEVLPRLDSEKWTAARFTERPLDSIVDAAELTALRAALERTHGNKAAAAKLLGISRTNLYAKMAKHGLA